ncbi:MAG: ABC transporter permease subunit [Bacteroidales bacterium]|nr:ABC transporter permease subunit [Bacteroidales bacterium]
MAINDYSTKNKLHRRNHLLAKLNKQKYLFLLVGPTIVWLFIFCYIPLYGVIIAFKDYNVGLGIWESPWVGLKHFTELFSDKKFYEALRNTSLISIVKMVVGFPVPIIFALMLNELRIRLRTYKKVVQTLTYMPHFLSWAFVAAFMLNFFSETGMVNQLLTSLNIIKEPYTFLAEIPSFFSIVVLSDIWKSFGFSSIIYLAAIAGINPTLYEAAYMDGAKRFHQIWYITIPCIKPTIIVLMILAISRMMTQNFEQLFLMQNTLVMEIAEILETYTYKMGLVKGRFSYSTAVGLFQSLVAFILLYSANSFSRWYAKESIF